MNTILGCLHVLVILPISELSTRIISLPVMFLNNFECFFFKLWCICFGCFFFSDNPFLSNPGYYNYYITFLMQFKITKTRFLLIPLTYTNVIEKIDGVIRNGQSRETCNIGYTRHKTKTNNNKTKTKKNNTTQYALDTTLRKQTQIM